MSEASELLQIDYLLAQEQSERKAAEAANDAAARDAHIVSAERYADRAWSLSEAIDGPFIPCSIWKHAARSG